MNPPPGHPGPPWLQSISTFESAHRQEADHDPGPVAEAPVLRQEKPPHPPQAMSQKLIPEQPPATGDLLFTSNWNNKLACDVFTTFRLDNPHYQVGKVYAIVLKNRRLKKARLVAKKTLLLSQVNEWMAGIDTGYDLETFRGIVRKMYTGKKVAGRVVDLDTAPFCLLLLSTVK